MEDLFSDYFCFTGTGEDELDAAVFHCGFLSGVEGY